MVELSFKMLLICCFKEKLWKCTIDYNFIIAEEDNKSNQFIKVVMIDAKAVNGTMKIYATMLSWSNKLKVPKTSCYYNNYCNGTKLFDGLTITLDIISRKLKTHCSNPESVINRFYENYMVSHSRKHYSMCLWKNRENKKLFHNGQQKRSESTRRYY